MTSVAETNIATEKVRYQDYFLFWKASELLGSCYVRLRHFKRLHYILS